MTYLNCTRCRLSIQQHRGRPDLEECPRCFSTLGQSVPLFRSRLPLRVLDAAREEGAAAATDPSVDPTRLTRLS